MLNLQIVAVVNASCCNGAQRYNDFLNWKNFSTLFLVISGFSRTMA